MLTMPLFRFEEIDSTSTRAAEMLHERAAPFAVVAERQTAGRGRRGRVWQSASGNLHITFALPLGGDGPELVPLRAGVLLAQWLERVSVLRVTLKWPNDILFSGAKLAGILCEATSQGESVGHVLVGVGINVAQIPPFTDDATAYRATSLNRLTGEVYSVHALADSLTAYFAEQWLLSERSELWFRYGAYSIERGQLWWNAACFARDSGLAESGALTLEEASGKLWTVSSVDHQHRWIYQDQPESGRHHWPLIVADVGNSSTKVALYAPATQRAPSRMVTFSNGAAEGLEALRSLRALLPDEAQGLSWPLHAISVNAPACQALADMAAAAGLVLLPVPKRPLRRRSGGYFLMELGIDRLAAMEAYLADAPDGAAVLVGAGTATTIDGVRQNGEHWGGMILPGLQTSLNALHAATNLLPQLDFATWWRANPPNEPLIGHATAQAMGAGVLQMSLGAIERTRAQAAEAFGLGVLDVAVIVTGGYGEVISTCIKAIYRPYLVLEGARAMVLGGLENPATPRVGSDTR